MPKAVADSTPISSVPELVSLFASSGDINSALEMFRHCVDQKLMVSLFYVISIGIHRVTSFAYDADQFQHSYHSISRACG